MSVGRAFLAHGIANANAISSCCVIRSRLGVGNSMDYELLILSICGRWWRK